MIRITDTEAKLLISALKDAAELKEMEYASNCVSGLAESKQDSRVRRWKKEAQAYARLLKELRHRRIKG